MKRSFDLFAFLAVLALTATPLMSAQNASAQTTLERIQKSGKVTIAHRESSVPLSYLDGDKKPIGYAVDLCLKLVTMLEKELKTKLKVEFLQVDGKTRIEAIEQGKADFECGSTTNNAERRKRVSFAVTHYITGAKLLVREDSPISRFEDLEGMKLVSTKGTTPLAQATEQVKTRLLRIRVLEATDHEAGVKMVEEGDADAFLMDEILLSALRATRAKPEALKIVGSYTTIEAYGIMLSRDDLRLKTLADGEMRRIITSGEITAIYKKWFEHPIPPKGVNLKSPMNFLMRDFYKYPSNKVPGEF